jgi:uncharacterized membrane protein YsdA (DUF1294 family)
MKRAGSLGVILAAAFAIMMVAAAVSFILYRFAKERAYNEKWEDYIDCGLA